MDDRSQDQRLAKQRLIRLGEVRLRVGLGTTTIYRYLARGEFPRPIAIGGGRVAWIEGEIDAWIAERIEDAHGADQSAIAARARSLAAGAAVRGGSAGVNRVVAQVGNDQEKQSLTSSGALIRRPEGGKRC